MIIGAIIPSSIPGKALIKRNLFVRRRFSVDRENSSEGYQCVSIVHQNVGRYDGTLPFRAVSSRNYFAGGAYAQQDS